jgi:hypothetical protein
MKLYYITRMFGEWQNKGAVEIIKFNQTAHGWHAVIRDMDDPQHNEYEMTIVPRAKPEEHEQLLKLFSKN